MWYIYNAKNQSVGCDAYAISQDKSAGVLLSIEDTDTPLAAASTAIAGAGISTTNHIRVVYLTDDLIVPWVPGERR
ncbi:hypothetical protein electrica_03097 [Klebsiella electrica]|nr:hypothetical protein electrica_03097 [Klebsiella electrica]